MMYAEVCAPSLGVEFSICTKLVYSKPCPEQDSAFQKKLASSYYSLQQLQFSQLI